MQNGLELSFKGLFKLSAPKSKIHHHHDQQITGLNKSPKVSLTYLKQNLVLTPRSMSIRILSTYPPDKRLEAKYKSLPTHPPQKRQNSQRKVTHPPTDHTTQKRKVYFQLSVQNLHCCHALGSGSRPTKISQWRIWIFQTTNKYKIQNTIMYITTFAMS